MIVVVQCAATKRPNAGYLLRQDGQKVLFVADPMGVASDTGYMYAHPDDVSDTGDTWRERLVQYNAEPGPNPYGLLPAIELYENGSYRRLAEEFGVAKTYILSAGWGLISASFLTPSYDITFNTQAKRQAPWKFRTRRSAFNDLCQLPVGTTEPVLFFGGKDYVPLFRKLTDGIASKRTVFFNASQPPDAPGCTLQRFPTTTRTNWHYQCLNAFLEGRVAGA